IPPFRCAPVGMTYVFSVFVHFQTLICIYGGAFLRACGLPQRAVYFRNAVFSKFLHFSLEN
ncbi:MAG: hypothetical protein Q4F81_12235, partial [Eubacteriales bacterium]|nr:hypothetical protein [Eubacteriales bacterium]